MFLKVNSVPLCFLKMIAQIKFAGYITEAKIICQLCEIDRYFIILNP